MGAAVAGAGMRLPSAHAEQPLGLIKASTAPIFAPPPGAPMSFADIFERVSPAVVSINRFSADTDAEIALVKEKCKALGVEALMADHWAMGGEGAADVARAVVKTIDAGKARLKLLYPDEMPLLEKVRTIAKELYRAKDITADKSVRDQLANFEAMGYGKAPVCIAKTQYSFSTNPDLKGAPVDHIVPIREVRLAAGAEFVVAICGDIMTMPGLPKSPAASAIDVGPDGKITGLF